MDKEKQRSTEKKGMDGREVGWVGFIDRVNVSMQIS
jgi:hypothetical protein